MRDRSWHILRGDRILLEVPVARNGGFPPSEYAAVQRVPRPFTITRDAIGTGTDIEFTVRQPPRRRGLTPADTSAEISAAYHEQIPLRLIQAIYHINYKTALLIARRFA